MSATYDLLVRAMRERKQVVCVYHGHPRVLCPVILGHTKGAETVLAFQVGGTGSKRLPRGGAWKCMKVADAQAATLQDGDWVSGTDHGTSQTCVEVVDYDVNPLSPYSPRFMLQDRRPSHAEGTMTAHAETSIDIEATADELVALLGTGRQIELLTARHPGLDLPTAYRVGAAVERRRGARGEIPMGRKIGFTNFRMWDAYAVKAPFWSRMYSTSIHDLDSLSEGFPLAGLPEPKLEPEIVFRLGTSPQRGMDDAALLGCIGWVGLGFEMVQSVYPAWGFKAPDAVAAFGLHAALVIGQRTAPAAISLDDLAHFRVRLSRNGEPVMTGGGADVLGSPLSALRHLNDLLADPAFGPPLAAGEIITTGTLTLAVPVAPGETWLAEPNGIDLPPIALRLS